MGFARRHFLLIFLFLSTSHQSRLMSENSYPPCSLQNDPFHSLQKHLIRLLFKYFIFHFTYYLYIHFLVWVPIDFIMSRRSCGFGLFINRCIFCFYCIRLYLSCFFSLSGFHDLQRKDINHTI